MPFVLQFPLEFFDELDRVGLNNEDQQYLIDQLQITFKEHYHEISNGKIGIDFTELAEKYPNVNFEIFIINSNEKYYSIESDITLH